MTDFEQATILAIDTSTRRLRLALNFGGDRLVKSDEDMDMSHGRVMIRKISNLFESSGATLKDLDAVVVCTGPGSFTGLRIGIALAKGIAVGAGAVMAGVSLFDVAAYKLRSSDEETQVLVPFKKDAAFIGSVKGGAVVDGSIQAVPFEQLPTFLTGNHLAILGMDLNARFETEGTDFRIEDLEVDPADVLHIGHGRLMQGQIDDMALLEPMYLQKSQAEIRFEQRRKNGQ